MNFSTEPYRALTRLILGGSHLGDWSKNKFKQLLTFVQKARDEAQRRRYGINLDEKGKPIFPNYPDVLALSAENKVEAINRWNKEKGRYIDWVAEQHRQHFAQEKRAIKGEGFWAKLFSHRRLLMLLGGALSFALLAVVVDFFKLQEKFILFGEISGGWATLISLVVSTPVLFAVWAYRDQNNLWQIENSRKDINLKDFQKLAEWASGQHFEEPKAEPPTTSAEASAQMPPPFYQPTFSINKAHGAEALQVAAIYQLIAFLDGEFGKHFQRPAFQLLKSIWERYTERLIHQQPREDAPPNNQKEGRQVREEWSEWQKTINDQMNLPLGRALHQALISRGGLRLADYAMELPGTTWMGLDARQPGMTGLSLATLNLQGINLQGADLSGAQLQGAYLIRAQLQGAHLIRAQLQGAYLREAQLQGADLGWAQLQGADLNGAQLQSAHLNGAQLQGVDFNGAQLQGADLSRAQLQGANLSTVQLQGVVLNMAQIQGADLIQAQLQGADLRWAKLQGADLRGAQLQGADLRGVAMDTATDLQGAEINAATKFGRLKKGVAWLIAREEDWIECDCIREQWIERGAVEVEDSPPTEPNDPSMV